MNPLVLGEGGGGGRKYMNLPPNVVSSHMMLILHKYCPKVVFWVFIGKLVNEVS